MSSEEAAEMAAEATESPMLGDPVEYSTLNLKHSPSPTLDEGHVMSERVQSLASQIYTEFENMIRKYDEEVVKELMPLIVTVLENLERAITERGTLEVNMELLKEDNHQLLAQFEREKQMRKAAEDRMFATEEAAAEEKAKFCDDKETLQSICKMLELKARNAQDQASRLEEKERELRRELQSRRDKYNDLLRSHTEHVERTKLMLASEQPISSELGGGSGGGGGFVGGYARFLHQQQQQQRLHRPLSQPDGTAAAAAAATVAMGPGHPNNPNRQSGLSEDNPGSFDEANLQASILPHASLREELAVSQEQRPAGAGQQESLPTLEVIDVVRLDEQGFKVPIAGCSTGDPSRLMQRPQQQQYQPPNRLMSDDIKDGAGNEASLYEEVSAGGYAEAIGEIDVGADIVGDFTTDEFEDSGEFASGEGLFGMSREIENLIKENADLIETKNALNIVKDDLIAKVDELTSEKDMLNEEVNSLTILKNKLKEKLAEMEAENKALKEETKKAKRQPDRGDDEDESVPMAQRKRFTRVEMSRVLMERNQYKERLMELQEAVRWTEMLRANKEPPQELKKKRGSLFGLANFFKIRSAASPNTSTNSSGTPTLNSSGGSPQQNRQLGGLRYRTANSNSSSSPMSPIGDPTRAEREAIGLPASQNRAYDFLSAGSSLTGDPRRQQHQQQQQQQQQAVTRPKPEIGSGRQHAYGWALPQQQKSSVANLPVPVPIYCRPLLDRAKDTKVWCAAAVSAGPRRQFNLIGDASGGGGGGTLTDSPELASLNEQLNREQAQFGMLPDPGLTSIVWICASEQSSTGPSQVCILNANRPAELLQAFTVCQSQILTIACVPGPSAGDLQSDDFTNSDCQNSSADSGGDGSVDPLSEPSPNRARLVRCVAVESPNQSPHASSLSLVGSPPKQQQQQQQQQQRQRTGTDLLIERGLSNEPNTANTRSASLTESTMWLGCQNGLLFVHSAVNNWRRCLQCLQLKDAIVAVCHLRGRVFLGLANGSLLVFCRQQPVPDPTAAISSEQQRWDLSRYFELAVSDSSAPVRAMAATAGGAALWIGVQNTVKVVDPRTLRVAASFDAHPRADSTVRLLCAIGEGVWIGFRLDTVLRLFHAHSHALLQEIDVEPYISQVLGTSRLGFSLVRLTSLFAACGRLWIGTSNGIIVTVPFVSPGSSGADGGGGGDGHSFNSLLPHVSMDLAQLSFHGHKDAVKFFLAVPGKREAPPVGKIIRDRDLRTVLLISGGEGYIDFRVGDTEDPSEQDRTAAAAAAAGTANSLLPKPERSHLIVWQVSDQ